MTMSKDAHGCRVELEETGQTVMAAFGTLILDILHSAGIPIPATCGGNGTCGKCRVVLSGERPSLPGHPEREHLTPAERDRGMRLACRTRVDGDIKIRVSAEAVSTGVCLQVEGEGGALTVNPVIRSLYTRLSPVDPNDIGPDLERLFMALRQTQGLKDLVADHRAAAQLTEVLRLHDWQVNVCLRDREMIAALPPSATPMGVAVDLGTTKIAGYLMALTTGETHACAGMLNPQGRFGSDIMSRLQHAGRASAHHEVQRAARRGVDRLVQNLVASAGVDPMQVVDACIVANTAMIHLLLDLPVRQLARAPYTATTLSSFDVKARDLGLNLAPGAYVHILPAIGGFVGADHVAMIMAAQIDRLDQVAMGLDIGTNTEIVLRRPDSAHLYCLSCPSGPAFEGAHVTNGMFAAAGAIEEVRLTDALEPRCKTIGNAPAIGLCGSGMIDVMAELYRCGVINFGGRFQGEAIASRKRFLLIPRSQSATGKAIWFTQKDMDEIQLAKGAIRAGIDILLEEAQTRPEEVAHVFIAGAFGSHINLTNAVKIGMIPDFPSAEYHQIGNAAAVGAKQALLDRAARQRAEWIAASCRHIDLTRHPHFNRRFAQGMLLPRSDPMASSTSSIRQAPRPRLSS